MRVGLIGRKLGMSFVYCDSERVPVTLLKIDNCEVVTSKTQSKEGYNALQIGTEDANLKNVTKPLKGHFAKNNIKPKKILKEFRVAEDCLLPVGTVICADHFVEGQFIDVRGVSIGKGFAGVMKRWNFSGLRASHGVSISHRSAGSTGQCQDPGRVPKGKKMAGQLGNKKRVAQSLRVLMVDANERVVAVNGAVPGSKGSYVFLSDAIKKALPVDAPYPAIVVRNV